MTDNRWFLNKLVVTEKGCWEWHKVSGTNSYGNVRFEGKAWSTHRLAYTLFVGEIPDGLFVCHHCDNPPCCNPKHLFVGTHEDNFEDMIWKNRHWLCGKPKPIRKEIKDLVVYFFKKGYTIPEIVQKLPVKTLDVEIIIKGTTGTTP